MANYAWTTGKPLPTPDNGTIFEETNFAQQVPHTAIFTGVTGLVFRRCNLTNCELPVDAVLEGCLHTHIEFCGNAHPKWVERSKIPACATTCSHVVDSDTVTIDGIVVDTIYYYADSEVA